MSDSTWEYDGVTISKRDGVCQGKARIFGTRMPVWVLEEARRGQHTAKDVAAWYCGITVEDVRAAWLYAREHRAEINRDIADNLAD